LVARYNTPLVSEEEKYHKSARLVGLEFPKTYEEQMAQDPNNKKQ